MHHISDKKGIPINSSQFMHFVNLSRFMHSGNYREGSTKASDNSVLHFCSSLLTLKSGKPRKVGRRMLKVRKRYLVKLN